MPDAPTLDAVVLGPKKPSGLLLWLHGLGADGHDFVPAIPLLQRPDLRVVLPHAPIRPVTINRGMKMRAWYDIKTMAAGPGREPEADIRQSAASLDKLLAHLLQDSGLPASRAAVVGFSQGGAMALHNGLRWPDKLAGVVALSTYLVLPDKLDEERSAASRGIPAFFAHGRHDPVVPISRGRAAYERLEGTLDATWRDYPMQHQVNQEELDDLAGWLKTALPPA